MSWSVNIIGTAEAVSKELDANEATLTGASLAEFKETKPVLQALLALEVNQAGLFQLIAAGHATFSSEQKTHGYVVVELKQVYGKIAGA